MGTAKQDRATYRLRRQRERHRAWITSMISDAQANGFYGTIKIPFQGGVMQTIKIEESRNPPKDEVVSV